jgi:hypothetical protein
VSLNNFQGTAALLNLYTTGTIDITSNGGTPQVLGLGLVGPPPSYFSNTSSPTATTEFLNGSVACTGSFHPDASPCPNPNPGVGGLELAEQPTTPNPSFLTATLNQIRTEQPTLLAPLASGVTDARFYRVFVDHFITGIHLKK